MKMEDGRWKIDGRWKMEDASARKARLTLLNWYHDLVYLAYMVLNINVKLFNFTTSTSHVITRSATVHTAVAHNQQR
jgi:hypothetical protein